MTEKTVKCPICRRPYKVYANYAGDQSACPVCVKAAENITAPKKNITWHKGEIK